MESMVAADNRISGRDLRLLRVVRGVRLTDLARAYGASRQRLTRIEGLAHVTPDATRRYLAALTSQTE